MKTKYKDKTLQYTASQLIGKFVSPGLLVTVAMLKKKLTENEPKVHTNTVCASVKNILP